MLKSPIWHYSSTVFLLSNTLLIAAALVQGRCSKHLVHPTEPRQQRTARISVLSVLSLLISVAVFLYIGPELSLWLLPQYESSLFVSSRAE